MNNKCFAEGCNNEATTEFCPECLMNGGIKVKKVNDRLTKENLINTFNSARTEGVPFVFVGIEAESTKEVIAVPAESFDAKEKFYINAYTDELVHVMNSKVCITGLSHGGAGAIYDLIKWK